MAVSARPIRSPSMAATWAPRQRHLRSPQLAELPSAPAVADSIRPPARLSRSTARLPVRPPGPNWRRHDGSGGEQQHLLRGFIASAGALTITSASGTGTGVLTVSSGGTLNANVAGAVSTANLLQTGGTVTESVANAFASGVTLNLSGGVTTLNQANSYTGGANISGTNVTTVSAAWRPQRHDHRDRRHADFQYHDRSRKQWQHQFERRCLTSAAAGGQFQNVNLLSEA